MKAELMKEKLDEKNAKAMAELEAGKGKRLASVDALMADLHARN